MCNAGMVTLAQPQQPLFSWEYSSHQQSNAIANIDIHGGFAR
jgi:hypothetical protein